MPDAFASLWRATAAETASFPPLAGRASARVAVIGGGYTGCSAALHLAAKGIETILVEADDIGWGCSGRNVGMVNAGLFLNPDVVEGALGEKAGRALNEGLGGSPALVRSLIEAHGIACDASTTGIVKAAFGEKAAAGLAEHVRQWRARGAAIDLLSAHEVARMTGSPRYQGGLIDHRAFTIHPLSYARGLARAAQGAGARIHEKTRAVAIRKSGGSWVVDTPKGDIVADHVVVAVGAYGDDLVPGIRQSFVPAGCFLCATEPVPDRYRDGVLPNGISFYDTRSAMLFARYDRDFRLVIGSMGWLPRGSAAAWARSAICATFPILPELTIDYEWDGTIDLTPDHLPWVAEPEPGLSIVGGYNGRGIGQGTFWGKVIADRIAGAPSDDLPIAASPPRSTFRGLKQVAYQTAFSVMRIQGGSWSQMSEPRA
jgi:Glycine/D-amino acid oxidases (deaminating)